MRLDLALVDGLVDGDGEEGFGVVLGCEKEIIYTPGGITLFSATPYRWLTPKHRSTP